MTLSPTVSTAREILELWFSERVRPLWFNAQKTFLYLPYMHSEDLSDQDESVALYEKAGLEDSLNFARHHRELIRRFGRFPHRNAILGRESTAEESAYLNSAEAFLG